GASGRNDERALSLPERSDQVDDSIGEAARGAGAGAALEHQLIVWVGGRETAEGGALPDVFGRQAVDRADLLERRALPPPGGGSRFALDQIPCAKPESPYHPLTHENVVGGGLEAFRGRTEKAVAAGEHFDYAANLGAGRTRILGAATGGSGCTHLADNSRNRKKRGLPRTDWVGVRERDASNCVPRTALTPGGAVKIASAEPLARGCLPS